MSTKWVSVSVVIVLSLWISTSWAKIIDGIQYIQSGGVWYLYDEDDNPWEVAPDLIHIKFNDGVTSTQIDTFATNHNLTESTVIAPSGYVRFEYDVQEDPIDVLEGVLSSEIVDTADLDTYVVPFMSPSDNYYARQWNLRQAGLERAWDVSVGDAGVTIAIFDQGVQRQHPDLSSTRWTNPNDPVDGVDNDNDRAWYGSPLIDDYWGWNFNAKNNDPSPIGPHGTAVAGIACATSNNSNAEGIASPAGGEPDNNPVKWVSVLANTSFTTYDGLRYCRHKGFDIINFSVGFDVRHYIRTELDSLYMDGALMVAASGNYGSDVVVSPADHDSVIAVGAVNGEDDPWNYTSYGPELEMMAPSGGMSLVTDTLWVPSTDNFSPYGGYNDDEPCNIDCYYVFEFGGTSAAAPLVAGVAALLWSHDRDLTNRELREILHKSAIDLDAPGRDNETGFGRVDAYRAITKWGTIEENTTWDQDVYVSGDLTVASGATLIINEGTTVFIALEDNEASGEDTTRVEITVNGTLEIAGESGAPVVFKAWVDSVHTGTMDWAGIRITASADDASIAYCEIQNARWGIDIEGGDVSLDHVTVQYADIGIQNRVDDTSLDDVGVLDCDIGIENFGAIGATSLTIRDCSIGFAALRGAAMLTDCTLTSSQWGIFVERDTVTASVSVTARNCMIAGNSYVGIYVTDNADSIAVIDCTVRDNYIGVDVTGEASALIDSCTINSNALGVVCYGSSDVLVEHCVIDSNSIDGIFCYWGSSIGISGNTMRHNAVGVYCLDASAPTIDGENMITNNGVGVKCEDNANAYVRNNKVANNTNGVVALDDAAPNLGGPCGSCPCDYAGGNNLSGNTGYHVVNLTAGLTISAECNYWGTQGPKASKFSGAVDYNPYLGSNPVPVSPARPDSDPGGDQARPRCYALAQNVPNPFNPITTIRYDVPMRGDVLIAIYNVAGQRVRVLQSGSQEPGYHMVDWDGSDDAGRPMASGVYFIRMSAAGFEKARKVVLLK